MSLNAFLARDRYVLFEKVGLELTSTSQIAITAEDVSTSEPKESCWRMCSQLRQSLAGLDEAQRQLECVLSFDDLTRKPKFCLKGTLINHLVEEIGVDMKLQVTITGSYKTGGYGSDVPLKDAIISTGMVPRFSYNDEVIVYEGSLYDGPQNWTYVRTINGYLTITMSGVLDKAQILKNPFAKTAASFKAGQSKDLVLFSKKIFTEQLETDVEIVSSDETKHRCHKTFLTGNSPVFQAMFNGDSFKEGHTQSVTMENLSEDGVVALLNYLYCIDSEDVEADYDCEICLELLETSEEYSMTNLQETLKRVFLNKPCEWFDVDATLQLFCFARKAENCKEFMGKCIQVLKSKHAEVMSSEDYKDLFKEDPEAAMDLCNRLLI